MQIANVPKGDGSPKINYIKIWPAVFRHWESGDTSIDVR